MPTADEIIRKVTKMANDRSALHSRMDKDVDLYIRTPFAGALDENGNDLLAGFKKFTANDPTTTMNLARHLMHSAPTIIRVRKPKAQKTQRETDNIKELWGIGILQDPDDRRADLLLPSIKESLSDQALFRGRTAQRVLLVKEDIAEEDRTSLEIEEATRSFEDFGLSEEEQEQFALTLRDSAPKTRTYVDVQDWDPRNTYWKMGKHGLEWACHLVKMTADQIEADWDITIEPDGTDSSEREFDVFDYFDETDNYVVMDGERDLKEKTPHGMGRCPVDIRIVGGLPFFQAEGQDYDVHYGESFYRADREMYDEQNLMLSILAEISIRSINQPLLVFSDDGKMTISDDPRVSGSDIGLRKDREDIKPLPLMEMVKESGAFMAEISSMVQRGTFPKSVFGELAFQLSGFAITQLRQGLEAPISPPVKSVAAATKGILDILTTAYETEAFDIMTVSGQMQDVDKTDFEEEITPQMLIDGGRFEVKILPQLPQNDISKANLARILTAGDVPLVDHRFARENVLSIQDVEQMERAVQEQLAKTGSPAALAFSNMLAAAEQGDRQLAELWSAEFQKQMIIGMLEMRQLQSAASGGQASSSNGQGNTRRGISSAVAPSPVLGIPTGPPNNQQGPIASQGTPRPNRLPGSSQ